MTALAGVGAGTVACLVWRRRHIPGAYFLGFVMSACALWCVCAIGEIHATTLTNSIFWARLAYVGIVVVSPSWLLFALSYTGRMPTRQHLLLVPLTVFSAVTVVFAFLAPTVPLLWSSIQRSPAGFGHPLATQHGPWFWVWITYSYGCLAIGTAALVHTVRRYVRMLTAQAAIFVAAVIVPVVANLFFLANPEDLSALNITPPSLVASGVLTILGITRLGALDTSPAVVSGAHDTLWQDMQDAVLVLDHRDMVLSVNPAAEALLGRCEAALAGQPVRHLLGSVGLASATAVTTAAMDEQTTFETTVVDALGCERSLDVLVSRLGSQDRPAGHVLVMRDVSKRKRLEQELMSRTLRDELTGLPNRSALREGLARALRKRKSGSGSPQVAVLMVCFAQFREINGTYGHEAGDRLLCSMARRLRMKCGESAPCVARLDGDTFAVMLPGHGAADAVRAALLLRRQLARPFCVRKQKISLPASIGVAVSPLHGTDASTLLRHADVARTDAKESPQGVAMYRSDRDINSPARLALLQDLRSAIAAGNLTLHYQPEIEIASGCVARAEALARWPQADGSMIPPGEFIPLAEQNGLLASITAWALGSALGQSRAHGARCDLPVAVNLSPIDLRDPGLVKRVERALEKAGAHPGLLWLEITETSVMRDPEQARRILTDLRSLGVRVAIDDFGVGHSSLAYLRTLPVCDVKIDRSFVRDVDTQPGDAAIVRATVTLAHDLGLTVTAEGVETASALERLAELGCDYAQGYHIACPMSAEGLAQWMASRRSGAGGAGQPGELMTV